VRPGNYVQSGAVVPRFGLSTLVIRNGLYFFFKSDPECLERIESIEPLRVEVTGEAGFLAIPEGKATDVEAIELCWIDRSI
jgi:hypothetical protein